MHYASKNIKKQVSNIKKAKSFTYRIYIACVYVC